MNLSQEAGESSSDLLFVNFNQDATSLAVGTKHGYKLFPLNSVSHFEPSFEKDGGEMCIIERLFSSSLVAMVELSNPRKLRVCHFKKNSEICTYSYPDTILSVKLSRQRLVVVLRQNLYIHNIRDMKVMHTIRDTPKNPGGLCALSPDNDNGFLAYPGSNQNGEIQVFDAVNLKAVAVIPAHESPLAALAFNGAGTKLASASATGTVIRVFNIPQGDKLLEFRRGMKRFIQINSLSFSSDDMYLVSSSSTETVHVFRLIEPPQERPAEEQQGWMSYLTALARNKMPTQMADTFSQSRAFAQMKLPRPGLKSVCTVACIDGVHRVLVATSEGTLYIGNIEPRDGGECRIIKEFRLYGGDASQYPDEEDLVPSGAGLASEPNYRQQSYAAMAATPQQQKQHSPPPPPPSGSSPPHSDRRSHSLEHQEDDETPPSTHTIVSS